MEEEIELVLEDTREQMDKSINHLISELGKVRAGRANASMLDDILVEAYGMETPLKQLANINTPDTRSLSIQPWDKGTLQDIERALLQANIGMTPQNDGEIIRLFIPPLTEERRKELVKISRSSTEGAKVSIRNARRDAIEEIKKLKKDGLSEDRVKSVEAEIQALTDKFVSKTDTLFDAKQKDIMTV